MISDRLEVEMQRENEPTKGTFKFVQKLSFCSPPHAWFHSSSVTRMKRKKVLSWSQRTNDVSFSLFIPCCFPLRCEQELDLFEGARVRILEKPVTLRVATRETAAWLEATTLRCVNF